jgi:hypothetical protein
MPDLDQERILLPPDANGIPGAMFCAPTATMNALYFLASHGFSGMVNYTTDWQQHYYGTQNIATLGEYMGTDGVKGTGGGMISGLVSYLEDMNSDPMHIADYWWADGVSIWPTTIQLWLKAHGLVLINWGKFEREDPYDTKLVRVGGHETTLIDLVDKTTPGLTLRHHNPITAENPQNFFLQSPALTTDVPVDFQWSNYNGIWTNLLHSQNPGSAWAVDGYTVIRPKYLVGNYPGQISNFTVFSPKLSHLGGKDTQDIALPVTGGARAFAVHPLLPSVTYLMHGSPNVWQADLVSETSTVLATLHEPRALVWAGKAPKLYVVDGARTLIALDTHGQRVTSATTSQVIDALAYDPTSDHLVAISRADNYMLIFDLELRLLSRRPLPPLDGVGPVEISIDGVSGFMWLHTAGSQRVTALSSAATQPETWHQVTLQTQGKPTGLFVDERGYLLVAEDGTLHEYTLAGVPSQKSKFTGLPSGGIFTVPRTFSNYDERVHGPRHTNPHTAEAPR